MSIHNFTIQDRQYTPRSLVDQFLSHYREAVREDRRLHCRWLPTQKEIPAEFFDEDSTTWGFFITSWSKKGLNPNQKAALVPHVGINKDIAIQLIQKHLDDITFEKSHKIAGCAYLASILFQTPR